MGERGRERKREGEVEVADEQTAGAGRTGFVCTESICGLRSPHMARINLC